MDGECGGWGVGEEEGGREEEEQVEDEEQGTGEAKVNVTDGRTDRQTPEQLIISEL